MICLHYRRFQVQTPATEELLNHKRLEPMHTEMNGKAHHWLQWVLDQAPSALVLSHTMANISLSCWEEQKNVEAQLAPPKKKKKNPIPPPPPKKPKKKQVLAIQWLWFSDQYPLKFVKRVKEICSVLNKRKPASG